MLFQKLGKMKQTWIMNSIILIIVAIVMLICPVDYIGVLISVLGYAMLIGCGVITFDYMASKKGLMNCIVLAVGLFIGLLGLIVMVKRNDVLPALSLLFGIGLILVGAYDFVSAFIYARRAGLAAWVVLTIFAVLTVACGIILLINPWWNNPAVLMHMIGYMLLYTSVVQIVRVVLTWPFKNA